MSLYSSRFNITSFDPECVKYYDNIGRVLLESTDDTDVFLTLDYNLELYPKLNKNARSLEVQMLSNISYQDFNVSADSPNYDPKLSEILHDAYPDLDYAMHGTVFEFRANGDKVDMFISFGGLIAKLQAPASRLERFKFGMKLYLLCCNTM
ncbi:RNA polymerase II subunit Rpb8 [Giardia lamblia P15]|uniref:DNA-directed RNA polymerases I, II, and III subunit RPABC3 n=1 Tax=Giardia intestinalis (strain P15) TaxID=658858 RepID=E1EWV9_GIAIA|nr:RNA polymerase II subunit Rpb8 [Giardia lamblia P15]